MKEYWSWLGRNIQQQGTNYSHEAHQACSVGLNAEFTKCVEKEKGKLFEEKKGGFKRLVVERKTSFETTGDDVQHSSIDVSKWRMVNGCPKQG